MSRIAVTVVFSALVGCNAVLGLEERGRAPDAAEVIDTSVTDASAADSATPAEDGNPDAATDTGSDTVAPCAFTVCGAGCVDTSSDPRHCGRCGDNCDDTEYCVAGACRCRPGAVNCGAGCVPITTSRCAACGIACPAGQYCDVTARMCVAACSSDRTQCAFSAQCVELTSPFHCGECGKACDNDEVCAAGECELYRPALGCSSCPCECGPGYTCCPALPGQTSAICVRGTRC